MIIRYNEKYDLIETKRGQKVYLGMNFIQTRKNSTYVDFKHVKEAVSKIKTELGECEFLTIDLGRPVGKCGCVEVTDENRDKVRMLYRPGKSGRTPVIINGKSQMTHYVSVGIKHDKNDRDKYHVFAAYYGLHGNREPWDKNITSEEERQECTEFWKNHALVMSPRFIDWERSNKED